MTTTDTILNFADYQFQQILAPGQTYLCLDDSNQLFVLKRLDNDCLHRGQLHPAIKDRLAHVRDLAHPQLATLRGVERLNDNVWLIWTYVHATHWSQAHRTSKSAQQQARDLISAVQTLHAQGIVHGRLHAGNVFVENDGCIRLTDISPYLYTEYLVDIQAVFQMVADLAELNHELLAGFDPQQHTLRDLANALSGNKPDSVVSATDDRRVRWWSIIAAATTTAIAVTLAALVRSYLSR